MDWGPKSTNSAYGLYPVESKDVYIDGCIAIGAQMPAYMWDSLKILLLKIVKLQVAGIEIENSYADVLIRHSIIPEDFFDLPDLPQQGGHHVRVFNNETNNDADNCRRQYCW